MTHRPGGVAGYTLAEALVALVLAGLLTACLAIVLAAVGRAALRHARVSARAETERTVAAILGAELRTLTAADATFDADSVRLRAFRGVGAVCAASPGALTVRYHGARMPEADKDSVLLVWEGGEAAFDVEGVGAGDSACAADATDGERVGLVVRWAAAGADPVIAPGARPAVALVFETGAYSLAGNALRYRRGAGGRQPLTEENLRSAGSALHRVTRIDGPSAFAVVSLLPSGSEERVPASWSFVMPQGSALPHRLRP